MPVRMFFKYNSLIRVIRLFRGFCSCLEARTIQIETPVKTACFALFSACFGMFQGFTELVKCRAIPIIRHFNRLSGLSDHTCGDIAHPGQAG